MRPLSSTLIAAQKKPYRVPYVEAKLYDHQAGVKRLSWTRVYTGSEPDNHHGIAFDGAGDMHRIRAAPNNKLFYQKQDCPFAVPPTFPMTFPIPIAEPPVLDQWTEIASDCQGPCAIAASGERVYIFYRRTDNTLRKLYSHDYGQTWTNQQLSTHQNVLAMAAAWRGTTNTVVCLAATSIQFIALVLNTANQSLTTRIYNHALDTVYGVGITFQDGEFPIIFAAKDTVDETTFYAIYASALSDIYHFVAPYPLLTAHEDQNTTFSYPDCHAPASPLPHESLCLTAVENYSGITAYNRPLFSYLVKDTYWSDATVVEPRFLLPISSLYGVRIITDATYWWLSTPSGLWRAPREADTPLDLTPLILSVRQVIQPLSRGGIEIQLDNSRATFTKPLPNGSEIVLKLGYRTTTGAEASNAGHYWVESSRFASAENASILIVTATDVWGLADRWTARYILRWNYTTAFPTRVWAILYQLLGRVGIPLHNLVAPQSQTIDNFYPKFLVRGGAQGDTQLRRLLSFVTDRLIQREYYTFVKDLRANESASYHYSNQPGHHTILAGHYETNLTVTHTQVSGETQDEPPTPVREHAFDWDNLLRGIDNLVMQYDPNLEDTEQAAKRAHALLRHEAQRAIGGQITVPVNCGQEIYDVITLTDTRTRITNQRYRILAIQTDYDRRKGLYQQRLTLGAP